MTNFRIHKLVNSREKEVIFRADMVKVYKINAHSPFFIGVLNHGDIGKPFGIEDFSDKIGN